MIHCFCLITATQQKKKNSWSQKKEKELNAGDEWDWGVDEWSPKRKFVGPQRLCLRVRGLILSARVLAGKPFRPLYHWLGFKIGNRSDDWRTIKTTHCILPTVVLVFPHISVRFLRKMQVRGIETNMVKRCTFGMQSAPFALRCGMIHPRCISGFPRCRAPSDCSFIGSSSLTPRRHLQRAS